MAVQVCNVHAAGHQALAQCRQVAFDQVRRVGPFRPQLAGQAAAEQLRLDLQGPQRLQVECQLDPPELLFGFVFFPALVGLLPGRGFLSLEFDLQWHDVLQVAHRDFQLPGAHQPTIVGQAGLLQARQLMALQARHGGSGEAQQVFQVALTVMALEQARR